MITIIDEKFKVLSQELYNKILEDINIHELPCSCGIKGQLTKHGSYYRIFLIFGDSIKLRIARVICKSCKKTHALLPADMVPYSQISIHEHIKIVENHLEGKSQEPLMIGNEYVDESTVSYIIKKYRTFWQQVLIFLGISIKANLTTLVSKCINSFNKQFMQIKNTINLLFLKPT